MNVPAHIAEFWQSFIDSRTNDPDPTSRFFEAFHFNDNERGANELAQLVLCGTKRATAGLLWSYEHAAMPLPKVGSLSVVTDWSKKPLCVIETRSVDVIAFSQVSEEFAATEGEGDGSLAHWKQGHWAYFGRECKRIRRAADAEMPVVCERFEVVFRGLA